MMKKSLLLNLTGVVLTGVVVGLLFGTTAALITCLVLLPSVK